MWASTGVAGRPGRSVKAGERLGPVSRFEQEVLHVTEDLVPVPVELDHAGGEIELLQTQPTTVGAEVVGGQVADTRSDRVDRAPVLGSRCDVREVLPRRAVEPPHRDDLIVTVVLHAPLGRVPTRHDVVAGLVLASHRRAALDRAAHDRGGKQDSHQAPPGLSAKLFCATYSQHSTKRRFCQRSIV